jgi:hypothetical protein
MEQLFADYFAPDQTFVLHLEQIVTDSVASAFSPVLKQWLGAKAPLTLLWTSSDPGDTNGFHRACDGKANTLVLIQSKEGNIFGGFAVPAWETPRGGEGKADPTELSFLFVLKNTFGDRPTRFPMRVGQEWATYHFARYGAHFSGGPYLNEIRISQDSIVEITDRGYVDALGRGTAAFVSRGTGRQKFDVESYEVWAAADPPTPSA